MRGLFMVFAVASTALLLGLGYYHPPVLWAFVVVGPLIVLGVYDVVQQGTSIGDVG